MRLLDEHPDWRELYETEISTAQSELTQKGFRAEDTSVVCDIFSLPSRNHQTFYGKLIQERGIYKMIYAKAIQNSMWFSEPIYMYTFQEAKRFENHPMKKGRIICRAKLVEKGFVNSLLFTVWRLSEKQPDTTVTPSADASFTALRLYEKGNITRSIIYTDASKLAFRGSADHSKTVEFLNDLHLSFEELIGIGE